MKGKKEKKEFDQNIGLHEAFLESVPSALIMIAIAGKNMVTFVKVSRVNCDHNTTLIT